MAEYKLSELFEDVTIDLALPGEDPILFRLRERTRTVGEKSDELQGRWEKFEGDTSDTEFIETLIDMIDVLLEPLGDGNNGTRTHAKTILAKQYKNDKIGSDRLGLLFSLCSQKIGERQNPPSESRTDD